MGLGLSAGGSVTGGRSQQRGVSLGDGGLCLGSPPPGHLQAGSHSGPASHPAPSVPPLLGFACDCNVGKALCSLRRGAEETAPLPFSTHTMEHNPGGGSPGGNGRGTSALGKGSVPAWRVRDPPVLTPTTSKVPGGAALRGVGMAAEATTLPRQVAGRPEGTLDATS